MVENLHNLIKIKALTFLAMRQQAVMQWATAGMIAQATESSPDSLYVLVSRWDKWGLVKRISEVQPFGYYITPVGHRYLKALGNWYRGDLSEIRLAVAEAANMVIWWGIEAQRSSSREPTRYKQLYYIQAPFQTTDDFVKYEMPEESMHRFTVTGSLITVQCSGALEAANTPDKYGITPSRDMMQVFVDEGFLQWKKET